MLCKNVSMNGRGVFLEKKKEKKKNGAKNLPTLVEYAFDSFLEPLAIGLLPTHDESDSSFDRLAVRIASF